MSHTPAVGNAHFRVNLGSGTGEAWAARKNETDQNEYELPSTRGGFNFSEF